MAVVSSLHYNTFQQYFLLSVAGVRAAIRTIIINRLLRSVQLNESIWQYARLWYTAPHPPDVLRRKQSLRIGLLANYHRALSSTLEQEDGNRSGTLF